MKNENARSKRPNEAHQVFMLQLGRHLKELSVLVGKVEHVLAETHSNPAGKEESFISGAQMLDLLGQSLADTAIAVELVAGLDRTAQDTAGDLARFEGQLTLDTTKALLRRPDQKRESQFGLGTGDVTLF